MPNFGELLFNLSNDQKRTIRCLENTIRKLSKAENALIFNETCINEDLLPVYTNIKTHDPAARDKGITKDYRKKLIAEQLEAKREVVLELSGKLVRLKEEFSNFDIDPDVRNGISAHLADITENSKHVNRLKITKKTFTSLRW